MGTAAVVQGDKITGQCPGHQVPSGTGGPQPAGPLAFSAPLAIGLAPTVLIGRKPAAVADSQGVNTPPHTPPLYPSDPNVAPPSQIGRVVVGSSTVRFGGKPAAYTGCQVAMCASVPGSITGSATTVLVGA